MEEGKVDPMYLENLDEWILEENKVVTYKFLSRSLQVHVNTAKQMLWNFVESKQGACKGVVYLVSGQVSSGVKVMLVKEEELEKTLEGLEKVFSQHVYSVQLSETVLASSLYATDLEVFKEDPFTSSKFTSITNPAAILREAAAAPKIAPGVRMEKTEVKKEVVKKTGGIENAFSKTKKASDEPVKSASVGVIKTEKLKSAEKKSPKKSSSASSASKKAAGGIANFFAAQAAKPKVEKKVEPVKKEELKEEVKEAEVEKTSPGKENVSNNQTKTKVEKKPVAKKPETKSFGKKDKDVAKEDDKKRKRIQVMSDSEEERSEGEEEEAPAPPPQAKLLESDSEDEVIPATPKEKKSSSRVGRRRVKRQVDKTYVDDDGYMVTKKVIESASETDDEPEPVKETKKPEVKKETAEAAPAAKKAKLAAPGAKTKNQGIAGFFTKKT